MSNTKCARCGLVNWPNDVTCRRCGCELRGQYAPEPACAAREPLFTPGLNFIAAVLVLTFAAFVSSRVLDLLDPETAKVLAAITVLCGIGLLLITQLWLMVRIFEQSMAWGVASLFVPLAQLVAVVKFWEKTRRSFIGHLLCLGIIVVGVMIVPG